MRTRLSQTSDFAPNQAANGASSALKEIPYDYVASFTLTGKSGERVQDVINTSVDGAFVAVAIGYGFQPKLSPSLPNMIPAAPPTGIALATTNAPLAFPTNLIALVAEAIAAKLGALTGADHGEIRQQLLETLANVVEPRELVRCLLLKLCEINFKYSIIDSSSGRELQNQPIHSVAGLGEATGNRPFRPMAKPMLFMPRSTIRMEIQEISEGPLYTGAELQIVLHGYKILGYGMGSS